MNSRTEFGRRAAAAKAPAPAPSGAGLSQEQRDAIRKVLWATPLIIVLCVLPVIIAKLSSHGVACNAKPAAERGLFEIDWCEAGVAAAKGAVQGVAIGAGRGLEAR
jgi:hypothetical protein